MASFQLQFTPGGSTLRNKMQWHHLSVELCNYVWYSFLYTLGLTFYLLPAVHDKTSHIAKLRNQS